MSRPWKQALLDGLRQQRILDEQAALRLVQQQAAPKYVAYLSGMAAWLASSFMLVSLVFTFVIDSPPVTVIGGVLLLGGAIWLLRRPEMFARQMGLALSLMAQGMLGLAVLQLDSFDSHSVRPAAALAALVGAGMLLVPTVGMHQRACAMIVMAAAAVLVGANELLALYGVLLAALAAGIWVQRSRWAGSRRAGVWRALAEAATLVALILPLFAGQHWALGWPALFTSAAWLGWVHPLGAGLLLLGVSQYLLRGQPMKARIGTLGVVLLLTLAGSQAPGLLIAAALWLAVFHGADRFWCWQVGAGVAFYLGSFYYSLHITLLHKSLLLIASGVLLLALRWCLLRFTGGRQ